MDSQNFLSGYLGWIITAVLCAVPLLFWINIHPLSVVFQGNFTTVSLAIGQIAGLTGIVMYGLNLIYSTRLRFLENMFGGLNKVFVAHHILGGLALILLCFHPVFLALSRVSFSPKEGALLLIPNGLLPLDALVDNANKFHFEVLQQWAIFFGILAFWGMVVLLIITFFVKLPYQLWLAIHRYLGLAFFFAGLHVLFVSSDTSISKGLKLYLLTIACLGLLAFAYRSLLADVFVRRYRYKVSEVDLSTKGVTQISMVPMAKKLEFKAGQFIFIKFIKSDGRIAKEWHPFSISSSPLDDSLRVSVKSLGDFTSSLPNITKGTIAEIEGAYGKFSHSNFKNRKQIWVAGGIGITPFLSMAKSLPSDDYKVDLYYSVRTKSELVDVQTLLKVAKTKNSNFRLIPFVSEDKKTFLSANFIKKNSASVKNKEIFICGPPAMMKSLKVQFKKIGVSKKMIHSEEFSLD